MGILAKLAIRQSLAFSKRNQLLQAVPRRTNFIVTVDTSGRIST